MQSAQTNKPSLRTTASAYTLAEVLITLTVVGIVAVLTIIIMQQYQKSQYAIGAKKAYNQFNQAITQLTSDKGCPGDLVCTGIFSSGATNQTVGSEFVQYFKVVKDCGTPANKGCWSQATNQDFDGLSDSYYAWNANSSYYKFITTDGMAFLIDITTPGVDDCGIDYSNYRTGHMSQTCGRIWVDVNGIKSPNAWGKDVFNFWITNGKGAILYPRGGADDKYGGTDYWWNYNNRNYCSMVNTTAKNGRYCTGRLMEKNWEMDY